MCGIFGFITTDGRGPNLARLKRIALETQRRGPHAYGLAWLGPDGRIHTLKRPGPVSANLGELDACRDAKIVIGHCRWATHGDPRDNRNNHPHPAGGGWIVHNGVVLNYADLVRHRRLVTKTACDSEVLGLLMAKGSGTIGHRAVRMAQLAEGPMAVLGIWRNPARLLVLRRDKPLHVGRTRRGTYLASLSGAMPHGSRALGNGRVCVLTAGKTRRDAQVLDGWK